MTRPEPRGWCPGAHRPMLSGDGYLVRIRPRLARLDPAQVQGLAKLAQRFGNGLIDLTSRANLQIRGVKADATDPLVQALAALGLLDADAATEARRNILTVPDWVAGDATCRIAQGLEARLAELPDLPAKFGFAVDAGAVSRLADTSADIRIERGVSGGLILRADGQAMGATVSEAAAVDGVIAMARWFAAHAGPQQRRMAALTRATQAWATPDWPPGLHPAEAPQVGPRLDPGGTSVGLAFGQISAALLARLGSAAIRVTPWRLLVLEGPIPDAPDLLTRPGDPLRRVDACPGAPHCASATVETRGLARHLAGRVPAGKSLHVSGCAKGCARARPADVALVGRGGRFDIVQSGMAWDIPCQSGLLPQDLAGAIDALQL